MKVGNRSQRGRDLETEPPSELDHRDPEVPVGWASAQAVGFEPPWEVGEAPPAVREVLVELVPGLVRRATWFGDGRRGAARLELGAGVLAGAVLLVEAGDDGVHIHLEAARGQLDDTWADRIETRLRARGIKVAKIACRG